MTSALTDVTSLIRDVSETLDFETRFPNQGIVERFLSPGKVMLFRASIK